MTHTIEQVRGLVTDALRTFAETTAEPALRALWDRLDGPLRVAVAGRVKAGKSTLLNALVGERLAPTDAGECTKIVSYYREGIGYEVEAALKDGNRRPIRFSRDEGALVLDLGDLATARVDHLEIKWPSASLREMTLIDTPGLASINDENSLRTQEFLSTDSRSQQPADAVIYLLRHLHRRDIEFLGSFLDQTTVGSSPVNSIGVLSRADEIGSGRIDALESARRIADRYRSDPTLSTLCSTVVPVAGLIAETAQTMRESEAAMLRQLAEVDSDSLELMLLTADDFCDPNLSSLTVANRRELLERFGLFGLRWLLARVQNGSVRTAGEMARALVAVSGLEELQAIIRERFLPRAQVLKAKNVLALFGSLVPDLATINDGEARRLGAEAERIAAGASEFQELRLEHFVRSGNVRLNPAEMEEVYRMLDKRNRDESLSTSDSIEERRQVALSGVERWRTRGSDPLADAVLRETTETMARSYENDYLELSSQGQWRRN